MSATGQEQIQVLHVDDEPDFSELTATFLEKENDRFTVRTATNASEGLEMIDDRPPDCVISDYDMPGRSGIEFLEAIRTEYPHLPFVLFTGKGSEAVASDAISAGVTDYLQKETGTDQYGILANRLVNAVQRRRTEKQAKSWAKAIETANEGIAITDSEGRYAEMNDSYAELYGTTPADLIGEPWTITVPDAEAKRLEEEVLPTLDSGAWSDESIGVRTDGELYPKLLSLATLEDGGHVCIIRDISEQKEREAELRQRADKLDVLFENSPDLIDVHDEEGRLVNVNQRLCTALGYSEDELLGMPVWQIDQAIDPDVARQIWTEMEIGELRHLTGEYQRQDGSVFPAEIHLVKVEIGGGVRFVVIARDVTERKNIEQELKEEREFITQALDTIDDLFYVVNTAGELQRWNERCTEIVGYSDERIEGMEATQFFPESEHEKISSGIEQTLTTGHSAIETNLQTADGTQIAYEFTGGKLTDSDGNVVGLVGTGRDISERKQREHKLTALHDVADDLSASESVEEACERTIDASREILTFDLSVIDIEEDGILSKTAVSEDLPPENMADMSTDEGIAGKTYRTGETFLIEDLGSYEDAEPQGPYQSAISVPIGGHGIFQAVSKSPGAFDRTDLELATLLLSHTESALDRLEREQQLQTQNERLSEFASVVSHDLRNPLSIAGLRLGLAQEECESEHLADVEQALGRMEGLINNLLTLARKGQTIEKVQEIALAEVVTDCWDGVETGTAELTVETERTVIADPDRLRQLCENLFRNAVEHGGPGVTVTVGTLPGGFYIEDDGLGIPVDERDQIFEFGYSTADGTGFGLAIVQEVVAGHDWELSVTNGEDGGTRFEVTNLEPTQ